MRQEQASSTDESGEQTTFRQQLRELLKNGLGWDDSTLDTIINGVQHPSPLASSERDGIHRSLIAHAMNLALLHRLLERVPDGAAYVREKWQGGGKVMLDHGALRTVRYQRHHEAGLPSGHLAFKRILEPLGYHLAGEYPLEKIRMCGFVYASEDLPDSLSQFFVSELYPEQFSEQFQAVVTTILGTEQDPLSSDDDSLLEQLSEHHVLPMNDAVKLLPKLVGCFERYHELPSLEDYHLLKTESREMAWISTEGNVFNHATDRVDDIKAVEAVQREKGRAIKPEIEVARHAKVQQTAFHAAPVSRPMTSVEQAQPSEDALWVPGSFFEFIQRGEIVDNEGRRSLDLRFDSSNAQGIFRMTSS
ncbi:2-oxoadipate dioxygenase/decarboxylase family protein [Allohahella marinimesophila]|uniref:2-oxoadipate dioxygenase/decarboxylase n=1 Tax=Allohahella marinimesophila TaxID=1054972 RepID=A0ABP7NJ54_9GAMM